LIYSGTLKIIIDSNNRNWYTYPILKKEKGVNGMKHYIQYTLRGVVEVDAIDEDEAESICNQYNEEEFIGNNTIITSPEIQFLMSDAE